MNEFTPPEELQMKEPPHRQRQVVLGWVAIVVGVILMAVVGTFLFNFWHQGREGGLGNTALPREIEAVNAMYNQNEFEAVLQESEQLLAENPNDLDALIFQAATWAQRGQLEYREQEYGQKALDILDQVFAREPDNAEAWRVKGYAHEIRNEYDAALAAYEQSLELDVEAAATYNNRGHLYDLRGDFELAKQDYERSLELDPAYLPAVMNVGRVQMRENEWDAAREMFEQVLTNSNSVRAQAEAAFNLSTIALYLDENAEASLQFAQQAAEIDPSFPYAHVGVARAYVVLGDTEGVDRALPQALELYPELTVAHEWLALSYAKAGMLDEAMEVLEAGKQAAEVDIHLMANERETTKGRFAYYQAALLGQSGRVDEAVDHLTAALTTDMDIITASMIQEGMEAGANGVFAPLIGNAAYDALARQASAASQPTSFLDTLKHWLVPVVQARILQYYPHAEYGQSGINLDNTLGSILSSYVQGKISYSYAFSWCERVVRQASGGGVGCQLTGDLLTGMTIGCWNSIAAVYIPDPPAVSVSKTESCVEGAGLVDLRSSMSDVDGRVTRYQWTAQAADGSARSVANQQNLTTCLQQSQQSPLQRQLSRFNRWNFFRPVACPESLQILHGSTASYEVSGPGPDTVQFTAWDTQGLATTKNIQVHNACPLPPVAKIETQEACLDGSIIADASQSAGQANSTLSYSWSVQDPNGAPVQLPDATGPTVQIPADTEGNYQLEVIVTDDKNQSATASTSVAVANAAPVAVIEGEAQPIGVETNVDGSRSYDPDSARCDDVITTYTWTVTDPDGEPVDVTNESGPTTSFTAEKDGPHTVTLEVTDDKGKQGTTSTTLEVVPPGLQLPSTEIIE